MERAELKRRLGEGAVAVGDELFLVDPGWGTARREEFERLIGGSAMGEASEPAAGRRSHTESLAKAGRGWLMIPSGGTGGRLKFARHDAETVSAAVRGFCAHFGMRQVNAVGVLPLYHVSGFMAWMRCELTGGEYRAWDWKRLEAGEVPTLRTEEGEWVISLVPTQLQRLLANPATVAWLRGFRAIFVGGGPSWAELLEAAARAGLRVALSYGMTETAAMVTALRPEEFAAGDRSCGGVLPHASVTVDEAGRVRVGGVSLFRGYWPAWRNEGEDPEFLTEDLGRMDERGQLYVLGRRDAVIITGGKKVQPAEVEAALRASEEFEDVVVFGMPDAEWGEAVVACYPATQARKPDAARATEKIAAWERPKRFVAVEPWPRNAQGKVDRTALRAAVAGRSAQ